MNEHELDFYAEKRMWSARSKKERGAHPAASDCVWSVS